MDRSAGLRCFKAMLPTLIERKLRRKIVTGKDNDFRPISGARCKLTRVNVADAKDGQGRFQDLNQKPHLEGHFPWIPYSRVLAFGLARYFLR